MRQVSRRPGLLAMSVAVGVALALAGCGAGKRVSGTERLQAQGAFERGVEHLNKGEWAAALTVLRQATALAPHVPTYRNALGLALLQLRQPDRALVEFQRATEIDPDFAEGHLNTGTALAELTRWEDAVAAYERALKSPWLPGPSTAHHNLGLALYQLKRYQEAETALRFALSLDRDMEAAWYHLGLVLAANDRKDEARAAFRRAHELRPDSPFGQAASAQLEALGDGG